MVSRLEAAVRIGPTNDSFDYVWDTGGAATAGTITLAHGLYLASALYPHIITKLSAVHADWVISNSFGSDKYVFNAGPGGELFNITWTKPALRNWLGWAGNLSGATSYDSGAAPGIFVATLPWEASAPGKTGHRKSAVWHHQGGSSLVLGSLRQWTLQARVTFDEVPQMQSVLSYLSRGVYGRWMQDTTDNSAWTFANFNGAQNILMSQPDRSAGWMGGGNVLTHATYRLGLIEYAGS